MKSHDMIGEMVYPLKRVLNEETMPITGFKISEIPGNPDKYDLKKTKVFLRFSLGKKKANTDMSALNSLKHLK